MANCTSREMLTLVRPYGGAIHGKTAHGEWDIEFPDAIKAMSFAQVIEGLREDEDNVFWVMSLYVRLRDGDSITDLDSPVVLTVW